MIKTRGSKALTTIIRALLPFIYCYGILKENQDFISLTITAF